MISLLKCNHFSHNNKNQHTYFILFILFHFLFVKKYINPTSLPLCPWLHENSGACCDVWDQDVGRRSLGCYALAGGVSVDWTSLSSVSHGCLLLGLVLFYHGHHWLFFIEVPLHWFYCGIGPDGLSFFFYPKTLWCGVNVMADWCTYLCLYLF